MPTPKQYATNAARQAAYRARRSSLGMMQSGPRSPSSPGLPRAGSGVYRRWDAMIGQACTLLDSVAAEMESYHEERSENWQESERGELFSERMESVEEAAEALRDIPSL